MPRWDGREENVGEICALKRQECREIAQETLQKVYRYVLPIMKKHSFHVHKLVEFLPKTQNLLGINVNHGQRISLRLRYHHKPREFLPFESVLGTMLHELCHNVYGPHNSDFFRLLDQLTQEMKDMLARGFTGDPFMGSGYMMGGRPLSPNFVGNRPNVVRSGGPGKAISGKPIGSKTQTVPYSVEKGKGRKLGGAPIVNTGLALRNLALNAAERRREADRACRTVKHFEDLTQDEQGEVIDLTIEEPEMISLIDD